MKIYYCKSNKLSEQDILINKINRLEDGLLGATVLTYIILLLTI